MPTDYAELIERRETALLAAVTSGSVGPMAPHLFAFQAYATDWALRRGRAPQFSELRELGKRSSKWSGRDKLVGVCYY